MEVYPLDALLRRDQVIDRFESLIWTERYSGYGDFELLLHSTREARERLAAGTRLAMNESMRVMTVENVEDKTDSEGRKLLLVKGRSLEAMLEDRVAKETQSALTEGQTWTITDTPGNVARKMFDDICREGRLALADKIPFLMPGSIMPASTIAETIDQITHVQEIDNLYNAVKGVCDLYDLGFRLLRNFDASQLYFDVYSGSDRTTRQTQLPAVVFAPELDNLQNTTELLSTEKSKNVAYVYSSQGFEVVYATGVDPAVEGFDRRVLMVKAEDLQAPEGQELTPAIISAWLQQKGKEELSKNRAFQTFDGEISTYQSLKYGVHYNLGDLVEMRNSNGATNNMRVTEQIFVSDKEGERSYPTLSIDLFITPGSWLAMPAAKVWADFGLTEYWSTL